MDILIRTDKVTKIYPLYEHPADRVKEALHPLRRKYHKNFYALKNIDMNIQRSECVGLIGMNGSGKSTLLQLIAGVVSPSSGTCSVTGRISALLELGAGFNPELTGLENVRFQCTLMGIHQDQIESVLDKIFSFADIGQFIHQAVKTYSSGMYVRLAFAAAVAVDPDILIVDEALAVGDMYFQSKCIAKIKEFREAGKTLIFVSHDAALVKNLCNRAYLLHQGQVLHEGHADSVFHEYNHLIAAKTKNIPRHDKPSHSKKTAKSCLQILSQRLKNEAGIYTDTIITDEKVTLEVEFKSDEDLLDPVIGFSIRDRMGIEVFGTNNVNVGSDFGHIQAHKIYRAQFQIKLRLGQNTYSIATKAFTSQHHDGELASTLNELLVFRVVPSPKIRFVGSCLLDASVTCKPFKADFV